MRLTSIAAGILILSLTGYPALKAAAHAARGETQQANGPMRPKGTPANAPASETPPQEQSPPQMQKPLEVQVTVVNVFVTVRDKHHTIISDLTQNDFKISEDGQEQKIAFFRKEADMPITLGILIDTSGSMQRMLNIEKDAASRFLKEVMRKKDEAMVISFDTDVNLLGDFTEDTSLLARAIRSAEINAPPAGIGGTTTTVPQRNGGTILYDAVYLACHDQLRSEAGRKAIILLTDAEDTGSQLKEMDAIESAQRADAAIHVLLIRDLGFGLSMGNGGGSVAAKMAGETGGRVIDVHNEKTLEKAFDEISEELRSQYVIGYYPTNSKHDGTFRKIEVQSTRSDTKILARKGYYAPQQ